MATPSGYRSPIPRKLTLPYGDRSIRFFDRCAPTWLLTALASSASLKSKVAISTISDFNTTTMLKKLVRLKGVGKFSDCVPKGDVEFRRLNLIFAPNGRGKTTLCDVLRSLQTGDADYLNGRRTLGQSIDPEVEIRFQDTTARFQDGAWDTRKGNVLIFGPEFIEQNVYSGSIVTHDHKKNLYQVILGEKGVSLRQRVEVLDGAIRDANRAIADSQRAVERHLPTAMALAAFVSLPQIEDVDSQIDSRSADIKALSKSDIIVKRALLASLPLPAFPVDFDGVLARTLADLSAAAEHSVRTHLDTCTDHANERWLSDGIRFTKHPHCPFCGQTIAGVALLDAYRGYFSEEYEALKESVGTLKDSLTTFADAATLSSIGRTLESNQAGLEFWSEYVPVSLPPLSEDDLRAPLLSLRMAALGDVARKASSPLEKHSPSVELNAALQEFEEIRIRVEEYNTSVQRVNALLEKKKEQTSSGNLDSARRELTGLTAAKTRHTPEAISACDTYLDAVKRKAAREAEKEEAKRALDEYGKSILDKWQAGINTLLTNFGAGFLIGGATRSYAGGSPSSSYDILINGEPVGLGDSVTPRAVPSFKNTLSAGDRSTLAFAFFIAQLMTDPELEEKIVVFDDPFSSLDRSRRTNTQQYICRIARKAKQVIVLSHEPGFLKAAQRDFDRSETKALQFHAVGGKVFLLECDLAAVTQNDYQHDYLTLIRFRDDSEGDLRAVARSIRPFLETDLRKRFPGAFAPTEWLGDMIDKIRKAELSQPLSAAQDILPELEAINGYSKPYHHTNEEVEAPDRDELLSYVERTLRLVSGF